MEASTAVQKFTRLNIDVLWKTRKHKHHLTTGTSHMPLCNQKHRLSLVDSDGAPKSFTTHGSKVAFHKLLRPTWRPDTSFSRVYQLVHLRSPSGANSFNLKSPLWHAQVADNFRSGLRVDSILLESDEALYRLQMLLQVLLVHLEILKHQAVELLTSCADQISTQWAAQTAPAPASAAEPSMASRLGTISASVSLDQTATAATQEISFSWASMGKEGCLQYVQQRMQQVISVAIPAAPLQKFQELHPMQRIGVAAAVLLTVVVPAIWKHIQQRKAYSEVEETLLQARAQSLRRQMQRAHAALAIDSVRLELPDIKETSVDPTNIVVEVQSKYNMQQMQDSRKAWDWFQEASKVTMVQDVYDRKVSDDTGPKLSMEELERISQKIRNVGKAKAEPNSHWFVSLDQLDAEGDFDDADRRAARVAQRKARMHADFLDDNDIQHDMTGHASGRTKSHAAASTTSKTPPPLPPRRPVRRPEGLQQHAPVAPPQQQLLEIKPRRQPAGGDKTAGSSRNSMPHPSSSDQLLEIRPRRRQPLPSDDSQVSGGASSSMAGHSTQPPLLEIKPRRNGNSASLGAPPSEQLLEIRPRKRMINGAGVGGDANASGAAQPPAQGHAALGEPVVEIRPKRRQPEATNDSSGGQEETLEISVKYQPAGAQHGTSQIVDPPTPPPAQPSAPVPKDQDEERTWQRSFRTRGRLGYIHQSAVDIVMRARAASPAGRPAPQPEGRPEHGGISEGSLQAAVRDQSSTSIRPQTDDEGSFDFEEGGGGSSHDIGVLDSAKVVPRVAPASTRAPAPREVRSKSKGAFSQIPGDQSDQGAAAASAVSRFMRRPARK